MNNEQIDLFCGDCITFCNGTCIGEKMDDLESTLEAMEKTIYDSDVKLALAFDDARNLTENVVEVLTTYERIDAGDQPNVFIPTPTLDRDTATVLYTRLFNIYSCLKEVRKNPVNIG